jgi:isopentenyl-diphosphate delta-isomerase
VTTLDKSDLTFDQVEAERDRKAEHIRLALDSRMQVPQHFFDRYRFAHEALPEIDMAEIDLGTTFLGKPISMPLLISCMTGGTEEAAKINRNLAEAAEDTGVALGIGSQRKAIEDPHLVETFQVRKYAPSVPLLANLGAVQLNYGFSIDQCRAAVDMIGADALVLHLNPLQEAIQPEGQCDFSGLLDKIEQIVEQLSVPVIAKEVGSGISASTGKLLQKAGVEIIDCAGVGGTSWARIEAARADDPETGEIFADWGLPTPSNIRELNEVPGLQIIGSGGVRNGLDVAKAIALGADLVGVAQPFLEVAVKSSEAVSKRIQRTSRELRIAMFCVGASTIADLGKTPLYRKSED